METNKDPADRMVHAAADISDRPAKISRQMSRTTSLPDSSIPIKKLIYALLAISLGTVIECESYVSKSLRYDFTIYSQMSKILGKVFFPSNDSTMQALSFWGVFFVGYISRPAGAVLFGHLGDTKGRSLCLLISVLVMGIPTVLIGCLPSYAHIGIAAPILLALLRLVQGLAMGGEFGAAMVYLHEIADPRYQPLTGSLGYVSLGVGVVIGILVVICVTNIVPADGLLVWGWRVPFLLALLSLVAATILRYNMPESTEFATSRDEIEEEYRRKLRAYKKRHAHSKNAPPPPTRPSDAGVGVSANGDTDVPVSKDVGHSVSKLQRHDTAASEMTDVESQAAEQKHYVPLGYVLRNHWHGLILQACYEAWIAASFYLAYSWLPSFFVTHVGLPTTLTLWMVLTSMIVFTFVVPVAGLLSDKGHRRVNSTIVVATIAAAMSVPMFLAFRTKSLAACWILQMFSLCLTAYSMGILPAICSNIYPAGVRISGFNLGYNLGMTIFGGCSPLVMTAIQAAGSIWIGPGLWMLGMAVITIVSCFGLIKFYPLTNAVTH